jgi:hypothetical protein
MLEDSNALVHQKNTIIDLIDFHSYEEAILLLAFTKELWEECSYGYKWKELQDRLLTTLRSQQEENTHWKQVKSLQAIAQRVIKL